MPWKNRPPPGPSPLRYIELAYEECLSESPILAIRSLFTDSLDSEQTDSVDLSNSSIDHHEQLQEPLNYDYEKHSSSSDTANSTVRTFIREPLAQAFYEALQGWDPVVFGNILEVVLVDGTVTKYTPKSLFNRPVGRLRWKDPNVMEQILGVHVGDRGDLNNMFHMFPSPINHNSWNLGAVRIPIPKYAVGHDELREYWGSEPTYSENYRYIPEKYRMYIPKYVPSGRGTFKNQPPCPASAFKR